MSRGKKKQKKSAEPSLKAEWQSWFAAKKPVFLFGLKFGVLLALFYGLLATPFCERILYSYLEANAWLANAILSGLGQDTHVSEVTIQSPRFAMAIRRGCDAVEPTWLLCAAMLSFPAPWKHRILGMLAGIILLQLLNLVRIITLYWIGVHLPAFFNSAHWKYGQPPSSSWRSHSSWAGGNGVFPGMNLTLRNPIVGFFCRFAIIFGLLIVPWPGWNELYGQYFRALGQMAFTRDGDKRVVLFEQHELTHGFSSLHTRMTLGNRDLMDSHGNGRAEFLDLDTRSIGWVPTALTIALILATPISWRRRVWALVGGLLLIHCFILFSIQAWIWDESPDLSLTTLSPFWKEIADDLSYTLVTQLGASFSVPVLIWIIVTYRRDDKVLAYFGGAIERKSK